MPDLRHQYVNAPGSSAQTIHGTVVHDWGTPRSQLQERHLHSQSQTQLPLRRPLASLTPRLKPQSVVETQETEDVRSDTSSAFSFNVSVRYYKEGVEDDDDERVLELLDSQSAEPDEDFDADFAGLDELEHYDSGDCTRDETDDLFNRDLFGLGTEEAKRGNLEL